MSDADGCVSLSVQSGGFTPIRPEDVERIQASMREVFRVVERIQASMREVFRVAGEWRELERAARLRMVEVAPILRWLASTLTPVPPRSTAHLATPAALPINGSEYQRRYRCRRRRT